MTVTRFAPSPTGYLHIGGLRTALYSYLWARKNGGVFRLRIEDTDLERNSQEALNAIIEAFNWVGLSYDGEVEYQSKRTEIYKKYINQLLESGNAYKCYMSKEELDTIANAKYYLTDKKELEETKNFVSDIESDASYELLVEFVKTCKVSMTDIANYSNSYLRDSTLEKKIDEEKARQILSKEIKNIFSIGQSYSLNYINSELLRLKTAYQLNIKLKTTLLENIYKIKKTTKYENGKSTNAVYIESLK
jgi:hypothetical protein